MKVKEFAKGVGMALWTVFTVAVVLVLVWGAIKVIHAVYNPAASCDMVYSDGCEDERLP